MMMRTNKQISKKSAKKDFLDSIINYAEFRS